MEPNTRKPVSPGIKAALEFGPLLVFFVTFKLMKDRPVTLGGTEYGGFIVATMIFVPVLALAAVAVGISGLFMETHPCPEKAWSDGPNSWPLDRMESLLTTLVGLDKTVKLAGFEELR